jgi:hypothetical protein
LSDLKGVLRACVFGAAIVGVLFLIITSIAFVLKWLGTVLAAFAQDDLPVFARSLLLEFADGPMAMLSPYLRWLNDFGQTWAGLLGIIGLILAIPFSALIIRRKTPRN